MARQAVFQGATLQQFRALFQAKDEYREAIKEMDLKERAFSWKPTTEFEKQFKSHIIDKALVKVGSGMLKVTSYRLNDRDDECSAYLSYGGKRLRVTAEGRAGDWGFFLTAKQTPEGLIVHAESKREHYKVRTWTLNAAMIAVGLFFAIVPGLLLTVLFFAEPRLWGRQIDRIVWPPLSALLGARR